MEATKKKIVNKKVSEAPISAINRIQDPKIKETVVSAKKKGVKINYNTKLKNPLEIEEYFKEELGNFLKESYNDIKERVSELRKFGYDGIVWTFKLMRIPLKLEVFLSTGALEDFNKITHGLNDILKDIIVFERKKKEKEEMKELEEKRKEEARKLKEAQKKTVEK